MRPRVAAAVRLYALAWGRRWPLHWENGWPCAACGAISSVVGVEIYCHADYLDDARAEKRRLRALGFRDVVIRWEAGEE